MLTYFLGLIFVVGGAFSQAPSPCVSPLQMEFRGMLIDHRKHAITQYKQVVYDAINKRIAWIEEDNTFTPKKEFHAYIFLYNDNIVYDINVSTKTCTKKPIDKPFHELQIPFNASFVTDLTMGGPGEELFAQMWSNPVPDKLEWVRVFSFRNCIPVIDHRFQLGTVEEASSTYFFDVVEGISDPSIFIPPPMCNA